MKYAITKIPSKSYANALSSDGEIATLDYQLALKQHQTYCDVLSGLGVTVIKLPADEAFPDACFVEDTFVIHKNTAIKCILGAETRKGEEVETSKVLSNFKDILPLDPPASIDGGDVIVTPKHIFIGISERTNQESAKQIEKLTGAEIIAVTVTEKLHLKTSATYIGNNTIIKSANIPDSYFHGYDLIHVDADEWYAADCLNIDDYVLIPAGHLQTKSKLTTNGFDPIEIDLSEFKKADGSITCLSIIFDT